MGPKDTSKTKEEKNQQLRRGTEPRLPHWFPLLFVPFGISLLMLSVFIPTAIPYNFLGPLGILVRYLVDNHPNLLIGLMWFSSITHIGEAIYAVVLCRREKVNMQNTLQWFLLVVLYGFFCLQYFKPIRQKST